LGGNIATGNRSLAEPYDETPVSVSCTLQKLQVRAIGATVRGSPAMHPGTVTLYRNGKPTALTCQTPSSDALSSSCSNTTDTVSATAGSDTFAWQVQARGPNNRIFISVYCQ
jgi:hypothetical protein